MVQRLPLDALNPIVWNSLIQEAMRANRWKLAYQLYVDMKRRGFIPSLRTYTTMFAGYSSIEDWSEKTKQLENVHTLFENYLQRVHTLRDHDPDDPELSVAPLAAYMRILGEAGEIQKMFDVYYAMDDQGPLAPNQFVFTAMFKGLLRRKAITSPAEHGLDARAQNAADAKLIWRRMLRVAGKNPGFKIDSPLINSALTILGLGRASDQLFAFDIVRDHMGLTKPGEEAPQRPLTPQMFMKALWLCHQSQKYRLCIHFFTQLVDRIAAGKEAPILDRRHMEGVLKAYASLAAMGSMTESDQALSTLQWMLREDATRNDAMLKPTLSTFTLVLIACWRGGDWSGAVRTFELMSGYNAEDFRHDITTGSKPRSEKRSKGRNIMPDTVAMSYIARTALATEDVENAQQCLRIIDHIGMDHLLSKTVESESFTDPAVVAFYAAKMAYVVMDLVNATVTAPKSEMSSSPSPEEQRWYDMKTEAKKAVKQNTGLRRAPNLEEDPLGSSRGLAATDSAVEQAFASRGM
ncbi:hypothetical protein SCP_0207250 [Sparassis crispa]|uniref:Pentatricopeptide repeat-containing protein n=1 Tax=Sparassis crispa TaxID=139825 RepID=A0A401GBI7_9APHY|nr:hypothetical protein SCP_0207250 [Sparassis crispa]GBE79525.1 hypothetical protein SCP_0207250 [Sparassis crispa]